MKSFSRFIKDKLSKKKKPEEKKETEAEKKRRLDFEAMDRKDDAMDRVARNDYDSPLRRLR